MYDLAGVDLKLLLTEAAKRNGISRTRLMKNAHKSSKTLSKINAGGDLRNRREFITIIAEKCGMSFYEAVALGRTGANLNRRDQNLSNIECSIDAFLSQEQVDFLSDDIHDSIAHAIGVSQFLHAIGENSNMSKLLLPPDWLEKRIHNPGNRDYQKSKDVIKEKVVISLAADMVGPYAASSKIQIAGLSRSGLLTFDLFPHVHGISGAQQVSELRNNTVYADFAVLGIPSRTLQKITNFRLLLPLYKRSVHAITRKSYLQPNRTQHKRVLYGEGGFGELFHRGRHELRSLSREIETVRASEPNPIKQAEMLDYGESLLTIDPFVGRIASLMDGNGRPRFARKEAKFEVTVGLFVNTQLCPEMNPDPRVLDFVQRFTQLFLDAYAESVWNRSNTRMHLMNDESFVQFHTANVGLPR